MGQIPIDFEWLGEDITQESATAVPVMNNNVPGGHIHAAPYPATGSVPGAVIHLALRRPEVHFLQGSRAIGGRVELSGRKSVRVMVISIS